jgi:hypothetical protein
MLSAELSCSTAVIPGPVPGTHCATRFGPRGSRNQIPPLGASEAMDPGHKARDYG